MRSTPSESGSPGKSGSGALVSAEAPGRREPGRHGLNPLEAGVGGLPRAAGKRRVRGAVKSLGARLRKCPARSWLAAWPLAFTAERRAVLSALIISTRPSALLGAPAVSAASTAQAAASASSGSDL